VGLVPAHDLPLQATLSFEACPDDIALTYLECVALTEGYAVTRDMLADLHKPLHLPLTTDASDDLLSSRINSTLPVTDIRRSINQLQYVCQGCPEDTVNSDVNSSQTSESPGFIDDSGGLLDLDQLQDCEYSVAASPLPIENVAEYDKGPARAHTSFLQALTRMSDALSAADSYVRRRPETSLEVSAARGWCSSED